jgi:hypothetical protein
MMVSLSSMRVLTHVKGWLLLIAILAMMTNTPRADEHSYSPADGFVPDVATAVAIAEAILTPIYGRTQVEAERPFSASQKDGSWTVLGHLKTGQAGGVAMVVIDKSTGRIIRVTHGR